MSAQSKNILIITNLYPVPWGPNRASFNKQQFDLLATGNNVQIVLLLPWTEFFKNRAACKSNNNLQYCPYFYIPKIGRRLVPFFQAFSLFFMLPWMNKHKPDVLYTSWGFPDAVASSLINKWLKLPLFVKVHGTDVNENTLFPSRRKLIKKWLSKADTIFCASQALADSLENTGITKEKLLVNYNGVNRDIFYPNNQSTNEKRIIFVGSLIPTKGLNELVLAFAEVQKYHPDAILDIIGEGPLKESINQCTQAQNLNINVHGSIPLNLVAEKVRASSLLVLPSYREGVPNVLLEAFACGIPVVATTVGGIPEVVTKDVGLLVESKNTVQLEKAISEALTIEWEQSKILEHSKGFDWQKNVECVLQRMEAANAIPKK
ncbi:glycosyltransferase [Colwellia sp. UCD-KL20]|uniref:glycosyltransferase n=1 Tax=Colwellia sp. UCD-KL20 TaxID=1917165 RepID=UPI000970C62C|nr:glycosyltransferase [Colwellia sp. UCD-KL20]